MCFKFPATKPFIIPRKKPDIIYSSAGDYSDGINLVLGTGYNFQLHPKFLLGIGGDWSALNNVTNKVLITSAPPQKYDNDSIGFKTSNRYSIFVTPSYVIDKDKLAYFKVGYTGQEITIVDGSNSSTFGESSYLNGYVLGLGYKQLIIGGLYGFCEGNYYGYSKNYWSNTNPNGYQSKVNLDVLSYTFLAGIGYVY